MKKKHRQVLKLIFKRPTSANINWSDIEALLVSLGADISERAGSRIAVVLFDEVNISSPTSDTINR